MKRLFCVAGEAGAGKTTLTRAALKAYPDHLRYLTTYTTRDPRQQPEDEPEYIFVSREEYEQLRRTSTKWDHGEFYGNWYGSDVSAAQLELETGRSLIVTTPPSIEVVHEMAQLYEVNPLTIYVKACRQVRQKRLMARMAIDQIARLVEDDGMTGFERDASRVFEPMGVIEQDVQDFNDMIGEYIHA